jgi:hypothetical protein
LPATSGVATGNWLLLTIISCNLVDFKLTSESPVVICNYSDRRLVLKDIAKNYYKNIK